jgi:hypothetical protein
MLRSLLTERSFLHPMPCFSWRCSAQRPGESRLCFIRYPKRLPLNTLPKSPITENTVTLYFPAVPTGAREPPPLPVRES